MKQIGTAFLLVLVGLSATAQQSAAPMVSIPLIATDSHHRPASVNVESLVITDQRSTVAGASLVRGADLPVELGVLIDASSSERSADLNDILKAVKQFVSSSIRGVEDRVFLLMFNATPQATEWLKSEQVQTTGLQVKIGGGTALYDAMAMACKERMGPRNWNRPSRRILVLVSDGEDNLSHISRDQATSEALKAGATIFTVDTDLSARASAGAKIMETLAKATGGESFGEVGSKDAPKVFAHIAEMMDSMFYVRYVPPDASHGALHDVVVRWASKDKLKLSYARTYLWNE